MTQNGDSKVEDDAWKDNRSVEKQFRAQVAKYERLKFIFSRLPETIMVLSAIIIRPRHIMGQE